VAGLSAGAGTGAGCWVLGAAGCLVLLGAWCCWVLGAAGCLVLGAVVTEYVKTTVQQFCTALQLQ